MFHFLPLFFLLTKRRWGYIEEWFFKNAIVKKHWLAEPSEYTLKKDSIVGIYFLWTITIVCSEKKKTLNFMGNLTSAYIMYLYTCNELNYPYLDFKELDIRHLLKVHCIKMHWKSELHAFLFLTETPGNTERL